MRKLQLLLGIILAVGAFIAVLVVGRMSQPTVFDVAVVIREVPAFTPLTPDLVTLDTQSVSPAVAEKYVLADDLDAMLVEGAVVVENLHPGQPLMREQVATGVDVEGLSRLAVALDDPDRVILSVPVDQDDLPAVVPGDVVALFFSAGNVRANTLVTYTVEGVKRMDPTSPPTDTQPIRWNQWDEPKVVTITTELELPVAKWLSNGVVYRLNQERRENPNYGAPGMENEPRYIEGELKSLDVVVHRDDAEWVAFALAHGEVQVGVLPAVNKELVEAGLLPPEPGVTWSDFEDRFFAERDEVQ
ncbi:MAG: hypothetical protein V3S14_10810 [Anaerolineae bacterium]